MNGTLRNLHLCRNFASTFHSQSCTQSVTNEVGDQLLDKIAHETMSFSPFESMLGLMAECDSSNHHRRRCRRTALPEPGRQARQAYSSLTSWQEVFCRTTCRPPGPSAKMVDLRVRFPSLASAGFSFLAALVLLPRRLGLIVMITKQHTKATSTINSGSLFAALEKQDAGSLGFKVSHARVLPAF